MMSSVVMMPTCGASSRRGRAVDAEKSTHHGPVPLVLVDDDQQVDAALLAYVEGRPQLRVRRDLVDALLGVESTEHALQRQLALEADADEILRVEHADDAPLVVLGHDRDARVAALEDALQREFI